MAAATRLRLVGPLCGLLMIGVEAAGDEPGSPAAKAAARRNAEKIPTRIAGTYRGAS